MRIWQAILTTALSLAGNAAAAAPTANPAPVVISARFTGPAPATITVETDADNAVLQLDPAGGQFRGSVALAAAVNDADLLVDYPDNAEFSLPLRLSAGTPSVAIAIRRPTEVKCTSQVLSKLGIPAGSLADAVHNYLSAKAINQISNNDRCGPGLRKIAAKTWFDTSYALVAMKPFFRLDAGASAAYAVFDAPKVAWGKKQADAAHLAAIYQRSVALFNGGAVDDALGLNADLKSILAKDSAMAKAAKDLQGISVGRLEADGALFQSKTDF